MAGRFRANTLQLTTSSTAIYECPTGVDASIHGLIITNTSASNATFSISVYKATPSPAATTSVASGIFIANNTSYTWGRPINLNTGDQVLLSANIDSRLVAVASTYEANAVKQGYTVLGDYSAGQAYSAHNAGKEGSYYYNGAATHDAQRVYQANYRWPAATTAVFP